MNEFGTTAWGRAWLRLAEPVSVSRPNPALPKARSLARRDRVGALVLEPGRITGTVDDGSPRSVELVFPAWPDTVGVDAGAALSEVLVERLAAAGTPVAPGHDELVATCGCTHRSGHCRHVWSVLFETARRVDEDPEVALRLRGAPRAPVRVDSDRIPISALDPEAFFVSGLARAEGSA